MLLCNILLIMLVTGLLGGIVNYYSDGNKKIVNNIELKIRGFFTCILLGFAATVLVPFFLKLADSKLIDNIYLTKESLLADSSVKKTYQSFEVYVLKDSSGKIMKKDTVETSKQKGSNADDPAKRGQSDRNNAQDYLLWAAYCLLAAAAGMRFIDMLINKLLTQAEVKRLEDETRQTKAENKDLKEEVQENKKADDKRKNNLPISEIEQAAPLRTSAPYAQENTTNVESGVPFDITKLPPVSNPNDPQKGRFGGMAQVNDRRLSVSYSNYFIPNFLNLKIKVESLNQNDPLTGKVYLFLHDSFAKSVVILDADGKREVTYQIPSYGAFTIGAVAENGETLLELDIAELADFPQDFRDR